MQAGGIAAVAWFAWRELGLGDVVKAMTKGGRR